MDNINYWNNFYQYTDNLCPSQFAAFIVNEYANMKNLIDFGCGSARDTIFFSQYYDKVIGIDSSSEAIKINNKKLKESKKISFLLNDLSNIKDLVKSINNELKDINSCIFYGRFFIYAIDENTENNFLNLFKLINNNIIALEFRTIKDKLLSKEFDNHNRRFVIPEDFKNKLKKLGVFVNYYVEGQGYAKYKNDDAYVARLIASANI